VIVTETTYPDHEFDEEDRRIRIKIETETSKQSVSFGRGEPEDMSLSRDLSDAYSISDLIKEAYEAGKRGEDWTFNQVEEKD